MRSPLVTFVCALGALALFLAMLLQGDAVEDRGDAPRPTTEERQGNGYRGALEWLERANIRTVSNRERFDKLFDARLPATGNLLIVTLPVETAFKTEEFRALDHWVRAGNTLLVLAALSDAPDWAFELGRSAAGDLTLLTGLEPVALGSGTGPGAPESETPGRPPSSTLIPNRPHAFFRGVRTVVALSDYPSQASMVRIPYDGFALALANVRETGAEALWVRAAGSGRIIVSGLGSLFTNRALGLGDNAQLLANMVGTSVAAGGVVLFDDLHQGLSAAYDPAKFYSDPRLYATVGILAALWLCWIFGAEPLRLPVTRHAAPREAELVRVTGGFLARVLTPAAAARGLFAHFFRRVGVRSPAGEAHDGPAWELLRNRPEVSASDLRQLQGWYADACAGRRVPLDRLQDLIRKLDEHRVA